MRTRLLFICWLGGLASTGAAGAAPSVEQIVSEWEAYEARIRAVGLSGKMDRTGSRNNDTPRRSRLQFAVSQWGVRLEERGFENDTSDKETEGEVFGWNDKYTFQLALNPNKSEWRLTTLGQPEAGDRTRQKLAMHYPTNSPLLDLFGDSIIRIVKTGRLKVQSADDATCVLTGRDVKVVLLNGSRTYHELEFVLDPQRQYAVLSAVCKVTQNKTPGVLTLKNTVAMLDGLPVPERSIQVQDYSSDGKPFVLKLDCEYKIDLGVRFRPEDFSLSHYGLPEPPGVTWERPTPTYVWLLLAAAVLGVVAVGCRWLLKRRAKAVPPQVPPTPTA